MSRLLALLLAVNIGLFVWNGWGTSILAQRPPETDENGVPFLKVNVNPTGVPPLVNINPPGRTPQVDVVRMPDLNVAPPGCDRAANFDTAVGQSVAGPIALAFLNMDEPTPVTLVDGDRGSFTVNLNAAPALGSTIYLRAGQRLDFASNVLYSGCRP